MKPKGKSTAIVVVSFLAIAGVLTFLYFKYKKPSKDKTDDNAESEANATPDASPNTNTGGGSGGGAKINPLTVEETKKFQDWLDSKGYKWVGANNNALTNGSLLNKGKGYGNFGVSTSKAWSLYGSDFVKATGVTPAPIPKTTPTASPYKKNELLWFKSNNNAVVTYAYSQPSEDKAFLVGFINRLDGASYWKTRVGDKTQKVVGSFIVDSPTKGWIYVDAYVTKYTTDAFGYRIKELTKVFIKNTDVTNVRPADKVYTPQAYTEPVKETGR